MKTLETFSCDYATARARFRQAATRLGWHLEAHEVGALGPHGEALTIDVARSLPAHHDGGLIISSGLHGIEGFLGSAVQLGLLERWANAQSGAPALHCVFLHGLNPFGFAWLRRCDAHNIDLNRNFLLPGEAYAGSPAGFAGLDALLHPTHPPSQWEPFLGKALLAIVRNGGMIKLKQAVAGGQYDYPQGLFYGGAAPSRTHQILAAHLKRWLGGCRRIVHLDFHTGLGKWATWKLLIDYPLTDTQRRWLRDWFGPQSFQTDDARGVAYKTRGSLGQWCVARHRDIDYLYAAAEFGTYNAIKVLARLRAENQAHHWEPRDDVLTHWAKQALLEAFSPPSQTWRQTVLQESYRLVERARDGLAGQRGFS